MTLICTQILASSLASAISSKPWTPERASERQSPAEPKLTSLSQSHSDLPPGGVLHPAPTCARPLYGGPTSIRPPTPRPFLSTPSSSSSLNLPITPELICHYITTRSLGSSGIAGSLSQSWSWSKLDPRSSISNPFIPPSRHLRAPRLRPLQITLTYPLFLDISYPLPNLLALSIQLIPHRSVFCLEEHHRRAPPSDPDHSQPRAPPLSGLQVTFDPCASTPRPLPNPRRFDPTP